MSTKAPYTTPTTPSEVRAYVLAETHSQGRAATTLLLNVAHSNLKITRFLELRIDALTTVAVLKDKLYTHTGTRPADMTLLLRSSEKGPIRAHLSDEAATLAACGVVDGDWVYVVDEDPFSASANGWLEDTSLVPKYEVSEEKYAQSENTYRAFKRKMREKDPNWSMTRALANVANKREKSEVDVADQAPQIGVGDRVEVSPGGKRGEVCFVGHALTGLPDGWWVGVRFDEPVGKNNGTVKGVRYFDAEMGYGSMVRPSNVCVGDFPVRNDIESDDDEI